MLWREIIGEGGEDAGTSGKVQSVGRHGGGWGCKGTGVAGEPGGGSGWQSPGGSQQRSHSCLALEESCGCPGQSVIVSVAMGCRGSGRATGEMSMAWGWQWWLWGDRAERRHQGDPALAQEAGTEKPSGGGGRVGFHVLSAPGASPSGGDLVMSLMGGEARRVFS